VLEQILHEADGRVDIAHRGGDQFFRQAIGNVVSIQR
jgi:hypothetical protein